MLRSTPIAILGTLLVLSPAYAQDVDEHGDEWDTGDWEEASQDDADSEDEDAEDEDAEDEDEEDEDAEGEDEEDEDEEDEDAKDEDEEDEGEEDDDKAREWYFGPYFRFVLVPAFIPELFLDEAPTVAGPAGGASANWYGDSIHYEIGLGFTSYSFEDPFRAKGDPVDDTEWVDSSLGLLHLTGSMLWESEISRKFSFEYGFGVDFGIVTGEMTRTEAVELVPNSGDWSPCAGVNNPPTYARTGRPYCEGPPVAYDEYGAHYGVVEERIPPVAIVPMLPHLALRWSPEPALAVKAEFAYGIIQLWLGVSVAYAPEL